MRGKAIIVGGIGLLVAAALSVNAQTSGTRTTAASLTSLLAARTQVTAAENDVTLAQRTTAAAPATKPISEPAEKSDLETKPAAPKVAALGAGCQAAIDSLKTLHQNEVAEDATERTATASDQAEDAMEALHLKDALLAARTACAPTPTTACSAAISALQAQFKGLPTEELAESHSFSLRNLPTDLTSLKAAFGAVAAACGDRE
ncbi:MAG TPA: hypothetical protein VFR68_07670 [Candidatus Dormibacteraeota bacterium]|nr:hypothetical protein [Candidatus Dormibacteraeota bacterium]